MTRAIPSARLALLLALVCAAARVLAESPRRRPVTAAVETTVSTRGDRIRLFAFDGPWTSAFAS